jgi:hypothetical protein
MKHAADSGSAPIRGSVVPAMGHEGHRRVHLPIIECGGPGTLSIPDDAAARLDAMDDATRHATVG